MRTWTPASRGKVPCTLKVKIAYPVEIRGILVGQLPCPLGYLHIAPMSASHPALTLKSIKMKPVSAVTSRKPLNRRDEIRVPIRYHN